MKFNIPNRVETVRKEFYEGMFFDIAPIGNHHYSNKLRALVKPFKRQVDSLSMPSEKSEKLQIQAMAGTLFTGWGGVCDENGKAVPFSEELAVEFLLQDPDAKEFILEVAASSQEFIKEEREEEQKK